MIGDSSDADAEAVTQLVGAIASAEPQQSPLTLGLASAYAEPRRGAAFVGS
jgi:hypothetical protein